MTEQKNLALSGGQVVVARPSELFTPRLWALATEECTAEERRHRIAVIAKTPGLRAEAARVLPELARMLDGRSTNAEVRAALHPLLLVKRKPDFGAGVDDARMTEAWLAIYYDLLRRFPINAVKAAVKDLLATHKFPDMPQPAELVAAAEPYAGKIRMAHFRLKEALRLTAPEGGPVDREANRRAMQEAGWLDRDGKVSVSRIFAASKPNAPPEASRPTESPQEMAARLRRSADR